VRSPLNDLLPPPAAGHRRNHRLPTVVLIALVALVFAAPALSGHDPRHAFSGQALQPPTSSHPLGTDTLGRDVLSRTLWGGRQTLGVALLAMGIAVFPGLIVGLVAGYYGGWPDRLLMAAMDVLLAFPNLLLALALIALTGTGSLQVALAVGTAGLPAYARMARTAVKEVRSALFIEAAYAIGAPPRHILRMHILPNIMGALLSFGGVSLSWAILNGAALSFLGFGGDPAMPDWGAMLNEGRTAFRLAPWIALPPGLAITLTIFTVNRLADVWQDS
jgi:peptide/nickel transport system permease protein